MDPKPQTVPLPMAAQSLANPPSNLWYAQGLRFTCTGCGGCCGGFPGYVWLDEPDMTRIAAFLNLPVEAFTAQYVRRIGNNFSLTEKQDYDCVFLERHTGQTRCSIYSVRPIQCRTWPFWDQNLKTVQAWTTAAARCPGMCDSQGQPHGVEEIERHRQHPSSP